MMIHLREFLHGLAGQNPVKTIVYWMLEFTSMAEKQIIQRFLNQRFTSLER